MFGRKSKEEKDMDKWADRHIDVPHDSYIKDEYGNLRDKYGNFIKPAEDIPNKPLRNNENKIITLEEINNKLDILLRKDKILRLTKEQEEQIDTLISEGIYKN